MHLNFMEFDGLSQTIYSLGLLVRGELIVPLIRGIEGVA